MLSRTKEGWDIFYNYKKTICSSVISHISRNESNNLNTSNIDNLLGTSNLSHINIQNNSSFNTLITLQNVTESESSASINNKITYQVNISE